MKFWHPLIGFIILQILRILSAALFYPSKAWETINAILVFLAVVTIFMFIYAVIRNIIRAIKAQVIKRTSYSTNITSTKPERTVIGVRNTGAGSSADYERWRAEQLHNQGKEP